MSLARLISFEIGDLIFTALYQDIEPLENYQMSISLHLIDLRVESRQLQICRYQLDANIALYQCYLNVLLTLPLHKMKVSNTHDVISKFK